MRARAGKAGPLAALERAIAILGSRYRLGPLIGVSRQSICNWERRGRVPAEKVLAIEVATGNQVTRQELRPDLYPPEPPKEA